jgi:poly(A) polymerase
VRDLLLGRRPKDFDIGTDAHPYQIKRLFRNCWIIGRRFRLAHIKFGPKTIEVATFRKIVTDSAGGETEPDSVVVASTSDEPASDAPEPAAPTRLPAREFHQAPEYHSTGPRHEHRHEHRPPPRGADPSLFHRDNTFGTPEEDAFRRDFTVNGLFYDIGTRSIIDYVGGLEDLERRVIRSIGDPQVRFVEDPVRMLRAAVFAARLGFDMDALVVEAIAAHRSLILKASAARMLEEFFKILRSGYAEASLRALARVRLLELIAPDLKSPPDAVWDSLAKLDEYRRRFQAAPEELSTVVLVGSVLVPLGILQRAPRPHQGGHDPQADRVGFGMLPVSRKDVDRLRQLLLLVPRLTDPNLPQRVARGMPHRPGFMDALTWLEIYGDAPDAVDHWKHARHARPGRRQPARPTTRATPPTTRRPTARRDPGEGETQATEIRPRGSVFTRSSSRTRA